MKRQYQINKEVFHSEAKARQRFDELKFEEKMLKLWEVSEQEDIFKNIHQVKKLVTRYTPGLPNNGVFRICDTYDVRRAGKLYSLQKYDAENNCWNNFKMGDDLNLLMNFMNTYAEVK